MVQSESSVAPGDRNLPRIPRVIVCSSAAVSNMEERERKQELSDSKEKETSACPSTSVAPEREQEAEGTDVDDDADKTDVCSEKFDPLLALYSPTVALPFPNVQCFNNVSAYESFLKGGRGRAKPENVEKKRQKAMKGVVDPERIARLKKLMVNNPVTEEGDSSPAEPRRRRQKPHKNVLTRMPLCKGSPLGELYHCVEEKIRVKVHIRTFKGLRGVCSGFVVAFDKFWNMAMVDVDETYREPLLGDALYHEKALTISRLFEKLKLQENEEAVKTNEALETDPTNPKDPSAHRASKQGESRAESKPSDRERTTEEKHKVPRKTGRPEVCEKKESKKYGRIRTRHVNQLFIRGENVLLVNPQPL